MLRQKLQVVATLCVVASAGLLTSCKTLPLPDPNVQLNVAGTSSDMQQQVAQYAAFDKGLEWVKWFYPIGCAVTVNGTVSSCDVLQTSPTNATDLWYVFYGPYTYIYEEMGASFNQTPKTYSPNFPKLTFQPISPEAGDCSDYNAPSTPCVSAPYCIQYKRCSQAQWPCTKCALQP